MLRATRRGAFCCWAFLVVPGVASGSVGKEVDRDMPVAVFLGVLSVTSEEEGGLELRAA